MTIVGDIAQATGAWAHDDWESVLEHLPARRQPRRAELTVGYRVPGPIMELAAKMLHLAAPGLQPPTSIRSTGDVPIVTGTTDAHLDVVLVESVRRELDAIGTGNVGVVVPGSLVDRVAVGARGRAGSTTAGRPVRASRSRSRWCRPRW